jgi:hypothetical protein
MPTLGYIYSNQVDMEANLVELEGSFKVATMVMLALLEATNRRSWMHGNLGCTGDLL